MNSTYVLINVEAQVSGFHRATCLRDELMEGQAQNLKLGDIQKHVPPLKIQISMANHSWFLHEGGHMMRLILVSPYCGYMLLVGLSRGVSFKK